jgi:hypothetical protein
VIRTKTLVPVLLALSMLIPFSAEATTGLAFLQNGVDARASLFGEAMTSHVDDASACFWNPAGLAHVEGALLHVTHVESFADLRHEYASAVQPLFDGDLVAGIYFNGLWTDDLQGYDSAANPTGAFGYSSYSAGISLGGEIGRGFNAGAGIKMINSSIENYTASGWAMDLGLQWIPSDDGPLEFGVALTNYGSAINFEVSGFTGDDFDLPTTIQGGVAYHKPLSTAGELIFSLEARKTKERDAALLGGFEYTYRQTLSMGVGYVGGSDTRDISLGIGFHQGRFNFAWAYIPVGEDLGDENRFSLGIDL